MKTKSGEQSGDQRLPQKNWSAVLRLYDACLKNANQLLDEAELLLQNDRVARALALALIAWEEIGKSQIVADYFNDMVSKKEFEEAFTKHEIKSAYNARQFHITSIAPFEASIVYDRTKAKEYSQYRIAALYVDCLNEYEPQSPCDVVTEQDARAAIDAGRKEIKDIGIMSAITERIGSKSFTK